MMNFQGNTMYMYSFFKLKFQILLFRVNRILAAEADNKSRGRAQLVSGIIHSLGSEAGSVYWIRSEEKMVKMMRC